MNTETKVSLEDALEMSLDDYISKAGIINPNLRPRKEIKKLLEIHTEKPSDSDVNMTEEEMPHDHSAQWRLYPPNNSPNRPSGMPPLIPIAASLTQKSVNRQKRGGSTNTKKWKFDDKKFTKECEYEEQRRLNSNGGGGVRNRTFKHNRNQWNRNQYHRNNNNHNNQRYSSNGRDRQQRSNRNDRQRAHSPKYEVFVPSPVSPKPSNQQQQTSSSVDCQHHQQQMLTNGDDGTLPTTQLTNNSVANLMMQSNNCTNLQALGNVIASRMTNLPLMTGVNKIFESIEAVQNNFMKKYDMQVQKEICKIQGREMLYKCGGVESVVSFDGPGIDCVAKLHTTDVSMNQRFS